MSTYGDLYKEQLLEAIEELENLSKRDYEIDEVKAIISKIGARTELFLKDTVFFGIRTRTTFFDLINELKLYELTECDLETLHNLRLLYNNSKHEPTYHPTIIETLVILKDVNTSIYKVLQLDLGITNTITSKKYRRIFWISSWWYVEGDIEVHIMLPDDSGRWLGPPSLDTLYINTASWEQIKLELQQVGSITYNLPTDLLNNWNNEGDAFLEAFSFEGYFKEVIFILAQYEKRFELMPGLMRHHNLRNMVQACLLASIHVFPTTNNKEKCKLIDELKMEAINSYAIPANYDHLNKITEDIVDMMINVHVDDWVKLNGIKFLDKETFEIIKEAAYSKSKEYNVFVDKQLTICIVS